MYSPQNRLAPNSIAKHFEAFVHGSVLIYAPA